MIKIDISDIHKPYTSTKCSVIYIKQHWNKYKIRYETQSKNIKVYGTFVCKHTINNWTFDINIILTFYPCDTSTPQYTYYTHKIEMTLQLHNTHILHTQDRDDTWTPQYTHTTHTRSRWRFNSTIHTYYTHKIEIGR
jgi:hypothetical protein